MYVAEISSNGGASWIIVYSGTGTSLTLPGLGQQNLLLQVKGVSANNLSGPWSQVSITAPVISYVAMAPTIINYDQLGPTVVEALHLDTIQQFDDETMTALGNELTQQVSSASLQSKTAANSASVTVAQQAVTSLQGSFAQMQTTLFAGFGASSLATLQTSILAQSSALSTLAAQAVTVQASGVAGSAGGKMTFVAASSVASGVSASWQIQLTSAATGGLPVACGMTMQILSSGVGQIIFSTNQFLVFNGTTGQQIFGTNSSGLTLNGVTQINGVLQSAALTGTGQPVLEIDFINGIFNWFA